MATLYWYGWTWNWSDYTNHWSNNSGNSPASPASAAPTSADNVIFDTSSSTSNAAYTVTLDATANCLDFSMTWPWSTNKVTTSWSAWLFIYWSFTLTWWTSQITWNFGWSLNFVWTSTWKTITTWWITTRTVIINWAWWWWTLQDNLTTNTASSDLDFKKWTLDTNWKTVTTRNFYSNTSVSTRTLTMGASTINVNWSWDFVNSWLTVTSNTAILNVAWNFTWAWKTYYDLRITAWWLVIDWNTFTNLTITGAASKTASNSFYANNTITWILTFTWNSAINRLLVNSSTKWTVITLTCTGATVNYLNCDFQDITITNWTLSTNTSVWDCWGNTWITFTSPTTTDWQSWTTWSTATWSVRVPLPQDTATFTTSWTATITQDMPRIWWVDFSTSANKTWTTSTVCSFYGSINLTWLAALTNSNNLYLYEWRGSNTLNLWGFVLSKWLTIDCVSWTLTLWSDYNNTFTDNSRSLTLNSWTLTCWTYWVKTWIFFSSVSTTRTLNMGSWLWEITWTASSCFNCNTSTNLTLNSQTSTIKVTSWLLWNADVYLGWKTYYNFWNATTWNYSLGINQSNTFNDFKINAGRTVKFTNSTTQTLNTFTALWTALNKITLRNSSSTTKATLAKAWWWVISCDYIDVDYIIWSPISTWYMWANSTDWWHNTNVYFTAPPWSTSIKSFNWLAYASVKTVNWLAIASVKTYNWLT